MEADASSTQPKYPGLCVDCRSIFAKKYNEQTLAITGGGRGIKLEVANLDHLEQAPESVTRLGATDNDLTYDIGRIYPVSPELTKNDIMTHTMTEMDTQSQTWPYTLNFVDPSLRGWPHTLPVMRCPRCLLFGQRNISCNGRARCRKCSGFHVTEEYVREDHCLFCGPGHRPTSKQCPARLQAVQLQELQYDKALDIKRKMRNILRRTFLPPKSANQAHPPSKTGYPYPPPLHHPNPCQIPCTPRTPTSAPTLAPRPAPFQAPIPTPILDPNPAPTKLLSPIISVVPLSAQPPTPKAQRIRHYHKRHTTKPSF
ncbi:hypothetical protein E2C01_049985 [Portunus trituberculatus]|uniref:Uncharacterized protein n=1 Tax=Portunus trituberculatus TaxID=210409 RepID=A0A5B7GEQ8_PORTR|nr:hypothetical protein [Portunus trituberculatus]